MTGREPTDDDRAAELERVRREPAARIPEGWERYASIYPGARLVDRITVVRPPLRDHNPYG